MQKTLGGYFWHLKAFFGATKSMEGCPLIVISGFWGQNQNLRTTIYGLQILTQDARIIVTTIMQKISEKRD